MRNPTRFETTLLSLLAGATFAWACMPEPRIPNARAQDGSSCTNYEVIALVKNNDPSSNGITGPYGTVGLKPLGYPTPFSDDGIDMPESEAEALFALPAGWEPFGVVADQAGSYPKVYARRCAD